MSDPASAAAPAGRLVEPHRHITITYDGQAVPALAGQSVAAALYAAGVRVFGRSFKYHRPRGLFCAAGECPNCLMEVDGRPNVRTCVEPVRDGQVVRHQNAWPSAEFDLLRVFDRIDRFLPVGFYYKRFHRPRWLWPVFERVVRHVAGLAAAAAAAEAGARTLLLDREAELGGHLLYDPTEGGTEVEQLAAAVRGHGRVQVRSGATAFGLYEGNLLGAFEGERFLKVRARQIVLCTGGRERPFVFHNNDLPGIFLGRGVQRLARLHGVRAGGRAVVLTDDDRGRRVAADLAGLGIAVAAVVDVRPAGTDPSSDGEWPTYAGATVVAARGTPNLEAVTVARAADGATADGAREEIACDLLVMASGLVPANELPRQAGREPQPGVMAAGGAAGTWGMAAQVAEGRLRGAEAAAALGLTVPALDEYRARWQAAGAVPAAVPNSCILPGAARGQRKRFICLCEDVTEKDLHQAIAEGFDHVETLKRYSTATMGPCQGKMCSPTMVEVCARANGQGPGAVGPTTSRPPAVPVELSVLAAGRTHPVRRTPLHHWHAAHGARWMDAGLWKRTESYGDPAAEVQAVRSGVGLIDVSTLGKIELVGPDAVELLERVYLNRWSDVKVGRARYGAMCNEDGILFDDGVGARLAEDRFYLTATTGNAEAVVQWLEMWQATWRLNVTVLNQTSALAAMNLAGPHAREVLARLTALDVSPAGFPYLAMRAAEVAGVPCRLLRIGFVGETGYEIHCPSSLAWHLWQALMDAGAGSGIRPFGVEAQRILRLEKGHLIIGQDTDALSTPLEAGLEWMVRFEKPLFLGRGPLLRLREMGARSRLVGFTLADGVPVPAEGCQVVEQGQPAGRVTSVRRSPTLGRNLGLAWVPAGRSAPGSSFAVRHNGSDVPAAVAPLPFYDPEGKRLKG